MPDGQKIIIACVSCRTKYNVTTLRPGTKFRCQICRTINIAHNSRSKNSVSQIIPKRVIIGAQVRSPDGIHPLTAKGMSIKTSGLKKGLPHNCSGPIQRNTEDN